MVLHDTILLVFALLVAILVLATIAVRLNLPYPIMLVIGGGLLGFLPGLPRIDLEPDLVLSLFLPPLIYSSAWTTSWHDFKGNLGAILFLAIGLVLVNIVVIALVAHAVIPHLPWPVAFVLGAVISPTDTVAANAITKLVRIAHRSATIIEGESLVNDATGLVAYRFAIAAVVSGAFSLWQAGLQFVLVSVGGIILGLLIAWPIAWLHERFDDAPREVLMSLLTPFAVYLLAEALGLSGVLATVAAGLYLGRKSSTFFSPNTRLQVNSFWNILAFFFNGLVFLLVGLEMQPLYQDLQSELSGELIWYALLICAIVIVVRLVWIFAATFVLNHLPITRHYIEDWRNPLIIAWTGMRGGVSLAAALAIPLTINSGAAFPGRNLVIFLTFSVILATLVIQGLSLGPLIRWLKPPTDEDRASNEYREALLATASAALARLDELSGEDWLPRNYARYLHGHYEHIVQGITAYVNEEDADAEENLKDRLNARRRLRQEILEAEREAALRLRNEGKITDTILRGIEHDLDLEEQRLKR